MKKTFYILLIYIIGISQGYAKTNEDEVNYWADKYLSVSFPLRTIKINSSFGKRSDPFTGESRRHGGLDLQARYEEVLAMFDGYVKATGQDNTSGKYIIIQHGNYTISYCHLSEILAKKGEELYAGDVVGISGNTGRSTGPHLHITCRLNGRLQDPYDLLMYVNDIREEARKKLKLSKQEPKTKKDFFEAYAEIAMQQQQKYGIPTSVTLAQMALESDYGRSELAKKGYNYFGIKANQKWLQQGLPYSVHDDDYANEKFCNFNTIEESVEYHSRLLMSDRYASCWQYSSKDYHNWLKAIKASGYATRKDYVSVCENIIKKNRLYIYDNIAEEQIK